MGSGVAAPSSGVRTSFILVDEDGKEEGNGEVAMGADARLAHRR